jgi:alpha-D-ribose 1-methylphosphonate 5-triphosphate synthase subunit PhnI
MRECFECSLRMKVEFEEVRWKFIVKVVDIRFGRTSFDEVVSTVEKFSGVEAKPSYLTRGFGAIFKHLCILKSFYK